MDPNTVSAAEQPRTEREHPRYAHEAHVTVHVGGKQLEGRTSNVSRGGLCADLPGPIAAGAEVVLDIQLVFDEATASEPLRIQARVAWCTTLDESYQVGLAFKPGDKAQQDDITMFLRFLDDGGTPKLPNRATTIDDRFG